MLLDLRELTIQQEITLPLGKEEETCGAREDLAEIHQCRSKCESAGCYQMLERWVHRGGKGSRGGGQVEKQKEAEASKSILEAQVVLWKACDLNWYWGFCNLMTPRKGSPGIALLAMGLLANLTHMKPKSKETRGSWCWCSHPIAANQLDSQVFTYLVRGKLGAIPLSSPRLVSLHAWKHGGAGPGQRTRELRGTRHALGGKCIFLIPIHDVLGKEKKTSYPNLGVREGFLEETVLELVGKSMCKSKRRRGFQAEGAAQEREWGISLCSNLSLAGGWHWVRGQGKGRCWSGGHFLCRAMGSFEGFKQWS